MKILDGERAMSGLLDTLDQAMRDGDLSENSHEHIRKLLGECDDPLVEVVIGELATNGLWQELNDRFYKTLAFGTGGLRGRTIGRVVTDAEQGAGGPNGRPEHPCVGTACMNYHNIGRAVRGLVSYLRSQHADADARPKIIFGHDTRHFSAEFARYCAETAVALGCDAYLFDGPRSTPQLSFAMRELRIPAGAVITASHNPSHDNGFKAYYDDGSQIVEPHASAIIREVDAAGSRGFVPLADDQHGTITMLGDEMDARYTQRLKTLLLKPSMLENLNARLVFTNLHGTGGHIIVPMLRDMGFEVRTVVAQDGQDGRFPTVDSPNPENAPALQAAVDLAGDWGADIAIGTDPDADRLGLAARDDNGRMVLLSGNQIGSLMAWYRLKTCFDLGWITQANRSRAVLIKTFVTTELQRAIADSFGVSVVDTLTGFKYIAAKLRKYEEAIPVDKRRDYRSLDEETSRKLRLEFSRFFVFGGEESYGYLGSDAVRDKDANGSTLILAEVAAYAKSQGTTLPGLLDDLYRQFGYHHEVGKSLVMEGADGARKIQAIADSFANHPPFALDGAEVTKVRNFQDQDLYDQEGDLLPKEKMIFISLGDGRSFAVRPSGTEPKIKFYLFGKEEPNDDLEGSKLRVVKGLESLWRELERDARARAEPWKAGRSDG